jgi:hypothetical protein
MNGLAGAPPAEAWAVLAGVLGTALSIVGTCLYLRDIRRGRTRPHRGSWLVWSVIGVLAALSHGADGGRWSLVVLCGQALGTLLVLAAAVRCGVGWFTPANLLMLAVAGLGVLGWLALANPTAAAASAAVADGAGLLAMVPKAWADPHSETLATYALAAGTGLLCALAIQAWDRDLLLFPVYFCLGNAATAGYIALRRRALRDTARAPGTNPRRPCHVFPPPAATTPGVADGALLPDRERARTVASP